MTSGKMVKILVDVSHFMPDRTTYKQYSIAYGMEHLKVSVEIPDKEVIQMGKVEKDGTVTDTIITPDGMAYIADQLASAIERIHSKWSK